MLKFYDEIEKVNKITIHPNYGKEIVEFEVPNHYFINPNNVLYTCFGEAGHKEANLVNTFKRIKDAFYNREYMSKTGIRNVILDNGLKSEILNYKRIVSTNTVSEEDVNYYLHLDCCDRKDPLVISIIIGIITSKIILLDRFIELEKSVSDKAAVMDRLWKESKEDINDILVRFCEFHKIESKEAKVITTTSLNLGNFEEYLDRDYSINIVPKIDLNNDTDSMYGALVIDHYLDNNPQYNGKIRLKNSRVI